MEEEEILINDVDYSISIYRDSSKIPYECMTDEEIVNYKKGNCWGIDITNKLTEAWESYGPYPGDSLDIVIKELAGECELDLKNIILEEYQKWKSL